jgi:toxin ParE1/3/4
MPNKYILTNKAVEDLSGIWNYYYETWSETQADKYYLMLLDVCQDLADGNAKGKQYPEIHSEILSIRAGQHIVFFRRIRQDTIEIIRIFHSRMDTKNRMKE